MLSMLEGFRILFGRLGYFRICREMVGIDREGRIKVWRHPNLSKN